MQQQQDVAKSRVLHEVRITWITVNVAGDLIDTLGRDNSRLCLKEESTGGLSVLAFKAWQSGVQAEWKPSGDISLQIKCTEMRGNRLITQSSKLSLTAGWLNLELRNGSQMAADKQILPAQRVFVYCAFELHRTRLSYTKTDQTDLTNQLTILYQSTAIKALTT